MRTKKDKPTAPPLAATLRAALASDWRTLAALDTLTAARGSDARRLVHEALRALRAEGCALEERVGRGGVEVRISPATLPAPRPDDGNDGLDADDREAARAAIQVDLDAEPPCDPDNFEGLEGMRLCLGCEHPAHLHAGGPVGGQCLHQERGTECSCVAWVEPNAAPLQPTPPLDAPASPVDQAAPVEVVGEPVARDLDAIRADAIATIEAEGGEEDWDTPAELVDAVIDRARIVARQGVEVGEAWESECSNFGLSMEASDALEPVWRAVFVTPKGPGPSSRCAVCGVAFGSHWTTERYGKHASASEAHPFTPKPRGRPRVAALDAPSVEAPAGESAERETSRGESEETSDDASTTRGDRPTGRGSVGREASPRQAVARKPRVRHEAAHPVAAQDGADAAADDARSAPVVEEGCEAVSEAPRCPSVRHDVQCEREAGHPCDTADEPGRHHSAHGGRSGWTDEAAAGWARRREEERAASRGGKAKRAPAEPVPQPPPCRPPACHWDDIIEPSRVRGFARPLCEAHRARVERAGGTLAAGGLAGVLQ